MKTRLSLFAALLCMSVFIACDDDNNPAGPGGDPSSLITGKNWKVTAATIEPGLVVAGTTITDFYAQMDACDKDDIQNFNANGTFTDDEGATKCASGDPQTQTGTWVLSTDKKTITLTQGGEVQSFTIESASASSLKVSQSDIDFGDGIKRKLTITSTVQ